MFLRENILQDIQRFSKSALIGVLLALPAGASPSYILSNPNSYTNTCTDAAQTNCSFNNLTNTTTTSNGGKTNTTLFALPYFTLTGFEDQNTNYPNFNPFSDTLAGTKNFVWWGPDQSGDNLGVATSTGVNCTTGVGCNGIGATDDNMEEEPIASDGSMMQGGVVFTGGEAVTKSLAVTLLGYNAAACAACPLNGGPMTDNDADVVNVFVKYLNGTVVEYSNIGATAGNITANVSTGTGVINFVNFANNNSNQTNLIAFAIESSDGVFLISEIDGDLSPEPVTTSLVGLGLAGMFWVLRRRRAR